jgi:ACR3 family arsenite efflux pump ArsB
MEEVLGWIVVPLVAFGLYWAWLEVRDQIKGTPLMTILQGKSIDRATP